MSLQAVCAAADVEAGSAIRLVVGDREVCVARTEDGAIHAIDDICTHGEVSLAEGDVLDCSIECWLHGSEFDLNSGRPLTPPAFEPVDVFACEERDGQVLVDTDTILNSDNN